MFTVDNNTSNRKVKETQAVTVSLLKKNQNQTKRRQEEREGMIIVTLFFFLWRS